jgi:hypothetical protein
MSQALLLNLPRQVDLGPGRPGGWTGPGLIKDPSEPERDPVFFFQMWDLKSISIYIICSQEKSHVFSMWDKKPFGLNTST